MLAPSPRNADGFLPGGNVMPAGHGLANVAYCVSPLSRLHGILESVKPKAVPTSPFTVCRETT